MNGGDFINIEISRLGLLEMLIKSVFCVCVYKIKCVCVYVGVFVCRVFLKKASRYFGYMRIQITRVQNG